ncbi:unnamed protein product [Hanseniaspora opuntiae]
MSNAVTQESFFELEQRINKARDDTKQLYTQINHIKAKNQDADLISMAKNVPSLNSSPDINKNTFSTMTNLKKIRTLKGHHNKIVDTKWSRDSSTVLSASQDGFMLLWEATTGLKKNAVILDNQWVLSCAISPNNRLVASAGLDNHCTIYKIQPNNMVQQNIVSIFKGHSCYISECEFISDNLILTASGDMTACKWDITKSAKVMEFSEHLGDILALAVPKQYDNTNSENMNLFATAGSDGHCLLWDSRQQGSVQKFLVGDTDVGSLQFFSNNNAIASGSDDGLVRLFDLRADCKISEYNLMDKQYHLKHLLPNNHNTKRGHYNHSLNSNTSHAGTPLSSGRHNERNSLFSQDSTYDTEGVVSLDFSSSGRLMYTVYSNYGCIIWDTLKGELVGSLQGHSNKTNKVKASNNGFGVLTGSWDETINIWTPTSI